MTTMSDVGLIGDPIGTLLEELLVEVVTGVRPDFGNNGNEGLAAALTEVVMVSFSRVVAQASGAERALLAQALAPALADLLAPVLAQGLAPKIVAALGRLGAFPKETPERSERGGGKNSTYVTRINGSLGNGARK